MVLGASVDSVHAHRYWCAMPREKGGLGEIEIHLIGDINTKLATDYNCLIKKAGIALGETYIIDRNGILR